jgi:predicted RNA polymerase sigma factor
MASFYRDHGRVVLAQVLLVVGERVLAEEIVQDTMLAVWRGAGSFRGESSVRSWVIAIGRRQTRDRLRAVGCGWWMTPSWPISPVPVQGRRSRRWTGRNWPG